MPDIMNKSCWSHAGERVCPLKGVAPSQLVSCPGKRPVWGRDCRRSLRGRARRDIFLAPHLVHTRSASVLQNCLEHFCWGGRCSLPQGNDLWVIQGVCRGEDLRLGPGCSFPESFSVTHGLLSSVQPVLHPIREGSTPTPGSE